MSLDAQTLLAILAMAAVTYATRIAGFLAPQRPHLSPRWQAAFEAIPAAVLVALVAPTILATGWRETAASLVAILAATRLPLIGVVAIGVAAIVALRHI